MAKVLIQNIADSLNLSRTTVSKVFNNNGSVAPATRERVLQRAAEMNYKYFSLMKSSSEKQTANPDPASTISAVPESSASVSAPKSIAVLFSKIFDNQHIGFSLLSIFGQTVSNNNFTLSLYQVNEENLHNLSLPDSVILQNITAILCIEIFDKKYTEMLCSLKKPILFIDAYAEAIRDNLAADILLMESQLHLSALIESIVNKYHLTRVGFVGPYMRCLSFYERWLGFHSALQKCGLTYQKELCILSQDDSNYFDSDWLLLYIKRMEQLPELFVCTNDFAALQVMTCLRQLNISVPSDIKLIGFDNSPHASMSSPGLTTIDSHTADIALCAAEILMMRIKNPEIPHTTVHINTKPVYRDSTSRNIHK